jgi:ATP-dependent DNA ligase
MFTWALALGLEGIVAKDPQSPYVEGPRVTGHLKIKNKNYSPGEDRISSTKGTLAVVRFNPVCAGWIVYSA